MWRKVSDSCQIDAECVHSSRCANALVRIPEHGSHSNVQYAMPDSWFGNPCSLCQKVGAPTTQPPYSCRKQLESSTAQCCVWEGTICGRKSCYSTGWQCSCFFFLKKPIWSVRMKAREWSILAQSVMCTTVSCVSDWHTHVHTSLWRHADNR